MLFAEENVDMPSLTLGSKYDYYTNYTTKIRVMNFIIFCFMSCIVFSLQCRVLLNLRTTQPFEEVLEDLGQVLKMSGAKRMYTITGQEVHTFYNCFSFFLLHAFYMFLIYFSCDTHTPVSNAYTLTLLRIPRSTARSYEP